MSSNINLLPPELKDDVRYSKLNAKMIRYVVLVIILAALIGLSFGAASFKLRQDQADLDSQVSQQEAQLAQFNGLEDKAKQLSARLDSVQLALSSQNHLSSFLTELARLAPSGVYVVGLDIATTPAPSVHFTVFGNSPASLGAYRDLLATSPKIAAVDIQSVAPGQDPYLGQINYHADFVVSVKPGAFQ